jgi:serine protease AprX
MSSRRRVHNTLRAVVIGTVAAGLAGAGLLSGGMAAGDAGPVGQACGAAVPAAESQRLIVRLAPSAAAPEQYAAVTAEVERCGGRVVAVQPAVGTIVVDATVGTAARLHQLDGVAGVTPDATATPLSLGFDPATQPGAMTNVTRVTGAQDLWRQGLTGAGVDVALIDTGVAPVPALSNATKVVVGPDLSFESQDTDLRYLDTFGHGTHMAGIIAGREAAPGTGYAYANDRTNFYGMAPDARLISIKVGANDGAVDVSQLIAAIDWVVQNRSANGLNIKVLNLSFGTDSVQSWILDPLSQAAEVASRAGILVVAAGGNDGESSRGLADPAVNPHVLAVGAADTKGTDSLADDVVPSFSQHSASALLGRGPDLVAPGVRIVSASVPGSVLAQAHPQALVGNGAFLRGSGTSQAAAVASGAAALIWQRWPNLSPAQIRELLVRTATPLTGISQAHQGAGALNLTRITSHSPALTAGLADLALGVTSVASSGLGSLDAARGTHIVTLDGVPLTGDRDIFDERWWSSVLATQSATRSAWNLTTGTFNGNEWIGSGFTADTTSVAGRTWSGRTWAGRTWAGRTWAGGTWTGRTWAGRTWAGGTWTGGTWDDPAAVMTGGWSSRTWASRTWA